MSLKAADLQKKHNLEGAPDPFPSLSIDNNASSNRGGPGRSSALDTGSETSFPSLASTPTPKTPTVPSAWATSGPKIQKTIIKSAPQSVHTFDLGDIDLKTAGKDGKSTTLGEVIRAVMAKTNAHIEASSQRKTGMTTFVIKADNDAIVERAQRQLTAMLSTTVTQTVDTPLSSVGSVIGAKGATLKGLQDKYSVKIQVPPRDNHLSTTGNGDERSRAATPLAASDDEAEEATVPVSVTGASSSVRDAIAELNSIIGVKKPKITRRAKNIPAQVLPFISAQVPDWSSISYEGFPEANIATNVSVEERTITVIGDKDAVLWMVEKINSAVEHLQTSLKSVSLSVPRKQHRLVTGDAGEDLLDKYSVVVTADDDADSVTIWGEQEKLYPALGPVLEKSNSETVETYRIPGSKEIAGQINTYLIRTSYLTTLGEDHQEVTVYATPAERIEKTGEVAFDFCGKDVKEVKAAIKEMSTFVKKLDGGLKTTSIDPLVHKILIGRMGKKIQAFEEAQNVIVFFPSESDEESFDVLLVYNPLSDTGNAPVADKQKHLAEAEKELLKLAADAADVTTETIIVEKKWHSAVVGKNGSTLNSIIGEDAAISIKVGAQARLPGGKKLGEDEIQVRGATADVKRAIEEIQRIVENAKQYGLEHSHTVEFEVNRDFVGRLVGSGGATVNKLRDQLNVRIDFSDEADDGWSDKSKKRKGTSQKSKVKITGRKENVEDAQKRLVAQIDKLEDETHEVLQIPHSYHSGLIGSGGKYVIRLEEKYGVKITFPRDSDAYGDGTGRTREALKPNEVSLKGGKKGVAQAKAELLDAAEFEKSNNQTLEFTIPTRAIARILGKGGAQINIIKDDTEAQIDIDKEETSPGVTNIYVRGTTKACKEAKAAILAIADEVGEEVNVTVHIENRFHRNFIGKGGETLRELISRVGGPSDPKLQAGLLHFPRNDEAADEVHLRGEKKLVQKLQAELERLAASYRDRVTLGVGVPIARHRTLIGRGGQNLTDLQTKTDTQIWFPGSRAYATIGEPENDVADVVPEELVKVIGSRAACERAIELLTAAPTPSQSQFRAPRAAPAESISVDVNVPIKYYGVLTGQGGVVRHIRSLNVFLEQSNTPENPFIPTRPPPASSQNATAARIDEDEEDSNADVEWQVIPNYEGAEEGDMVWTLRGKDQAALDSAQNLLATAIENAAAASHVGFLTLADSSAFPRIVGTKGANVSRLRAETGAEITVGRENSTIIIVGSEDALEAAKTAILQTASRSGRSRRDD